MFIPAVGCPPATPSGQPTAGIRAARSQLLSGLAQSKSTKHRFKTKRSQPFLGNDRFGKGENFTSLLIGDENVKNAKEYVKQTKELADNSSTINAIRDRLKIIANRKSVQRWSTALNGESDEADDEDAAMCDAR